MIGFRAARRRSFRSIRLRGLLVLVAVVGLGLGGWRWWHASVVLGRLAYQHEWMAFITRDLGHPRWGLSEHRIALIAYHQRLQRKYEAARWRPWASVEPDPPPPEPTPPPWRCRLDSSDPAFEYDPAFRTWLGNDPWGLLGIQWIVPDPSPAFNP